MGGDAYIKSDPAIERWARMREGTIPHFRWTKRTAAYSFVFGLLVPLGMYELAVIDQKTRAEAAHKADKGYPSFLNAGPAKLPADAAAAAE